MSVSVRKVGWFAAGVLLLMGPVLGWGGYRLAFRRETERALAEFDSDLAERALLLEHEISANVEILRAMASLYTGRGEPSHSEFVAFAGNAVLRHPAMLALQWAPRIRKEDREKHEHQAGRDLGAEYRIRERNRKGELVPASPRHDYFPVRFVQPLVGNEAALGFDLASEEVRRAALLRAAESGEATLSDPLTLDQERGRSQGFLAFVPTYSKAPDQRTVDREGLTGFVVAVFRVERLLDLWMAQVRERGPLHMQFSLIDDDAAGKRVVMYSYSAGGREEVTPAGSREARLSVGGQQWHLIARPTQPYLAVRRTRQPLAISVSVFLVWSLLVGLLAALWNWSHGMEERRRSATLRSVLRSVSDGVVVADEDGRFVFTNDAARRIMGSSGWQAPPSEWSADFGLFLPDTKTPFPPDQLPLARAMRGEQVEETDIFVRNPHHPEGAWLRVSGAPLLDDSGTVRGGVAAFRDVTARQRSEEAIRRLSSAVEHTADAVVITSREGRIEYINPAFEATTGYPKEEVIGQNPRILKSGKHDADFYRGFWSTILAGEVYRGAIINRKKSGELYYAEQSVTPIRDASGSVTQFVSVIRDMTERRKRLEQETELRLAGLIQQRLFPQRSPQIEGLDIAGAAFPAASVCGDYIDYIPMPNGSLGIAIGDVCGHGIGPALVMAQTRAYLRSLVAAGLELGRIFERMNNALAEDLEDNHYVTLLLVELDVAGGRLRYASAGHPTGYVLDLSGRIKAGLSSTGLPLGMFPDQRFAIGPELSLDSGDLVVLLTDGITEREAPDGRQFGEEGVLAVAREDRHLPAREIVDRLHQAALGFGEGERQVDDITIVLFKIAPSDNA